MAEDFWQVQDQKALFSSWPQASETFQQNHEWQVWERLAQSQWDKFDESNCWLALASNLHWEEAQPIRSAGFRSCELKLFVYLLVSYPTRPVLKDILISRFADWLIFLTWFILTSVTCRMAWSTLWPSQEWSSSGLTTRTISIIWSFHSKGMQFWHGRFLSTWILNLWRCNWIAHNGRRWMCWTSTTLSVGNVFLAFRCLMTSLVLTLWFQDPLNQLSRTASGLQKDLFSTTSCFWLTTSGLLTMPRTNQDNISCLLWLIFFSEGDQQFIDTVTKNIQKEQEEVNVNVTVTAEDLLIDQLLKGIEQSELKDFQSLKPKEGKQKAAEVAQWRQWYAEKVKEVKVSWFDNWVQSLLLNFNSGQEFLLIVS